MAEVAACYKASPATDLYKPSVKIGIAIFKNSN